MCTKSKSVKYPRINSLLKDYSNVVYNNLLGNCMSNKNLVILENYNIVLRRDYKSMRGKVRIIGGGGSGIEPSEVDYIGKGMLTAAVMGEMYSSPSAEEIFIAIKEVALNSSDGVLLLVKNYVGDKLNFGLALDKAISEEIKIRMLIIGDDAFEPDSKKHGRRALAGSILIYKIAGEMAESDKSLEEIVDECRNIILTDLVTMSVNLPACGKTFCESLGPYIEPDEMVLGMGLYGQHGKKKMKFTNIGNTVSIVLLELLNNSMAKMGAPFKNAVVLINNYGSTSKLIENIIAYELTKELNKKNINILLLYCGKLFSNRNSNGFSVTLLKVESPKTVKYLEAPTSASAWPKPRGLNLDKKDAEYKDLPLVIKAERNYDSSHDGKFENAHPGPKIDEKESLALKQCIEFAAEALISCEDQLNVIDSESGDGDTGTQLKLGATAIKQAIYDKKLDFTWPYKLFSDISQLCSASMGGISGALYHIFFNSLAKSIQNSNEITPELCSRAFKCATKTIKHYGKVDIGDRTFFDVLSPAADSFEAVIANGLDVTSALFKAAVTCEYKSEELKLVIPKCLKNLNVEKPLLYSDAGAHAVTIWLRALSEGLRLLHPCKY